MWRGFCLKAKAVGLIADRTSRHLLQISTVLVVFFSFRPDPQKAARFGHGRARFKLMEQGVEPEIEAERFDEDADFDGDSAFGSSSSESVTETLQSRLLRGVEEYGRVYASYGKEEYGLPIDEQELDRIDMSHAKLLVVLEKKLFLAPIDPDPQRILDLGTGTGIWAIDVADEYPSSEVIGCDIAPVQPTWVPTNCKFEIEDIEQPWTWRKESFDFIHARSLMLCIRDWPRLARQCYEHTKPGGYTEFQTIYPKLLCDDDSTPPSSGLMEFSRLSHEATALAGFPLSDLNYFSSYLRSAGFVDIVEKRYKCPSSPWPKDKRMKLIGAFEMHNLMSGISGMSFRMFGKAFGWSREQTEAFLVHVRRDARDMRFHTYWEFIVCYGRKPERGNDKTTEEQDVDEGVAV